MIIQLDSTESNAPISVALACRKIEIDLFQVVEED
jgi:hypothetical protein